MQEKMIKALQWIVDILDSKNMPYMIGGGFAAHIYGSQRPINDIDISISGKYFPEIIPLVSEYITAGPKHYSNEKWDCDTLSLNYHGQDIDLTDVDTLTMSTKDKTSWVKPKDLYRKYPAVQKQIAGVTVSLMDPRDLVAYKKELDGGHQVVDIAAVEKYIKDNNF